MEDRFLEVYLGEIYAECNSCLENSDRMRQMIAAGPMADTFFSEAHGFLSHAAAVSRYLWPPPTVRGRGRQRGVDLLMALGIDGDHAVANRDIRNHVEHFDERLDAWMERTEQRNMIHRNIGPLDMFIRMGVELGDIFENYDPIKDVIVFQGQSFSIGKLVEGIRDIQARAAQCVTDVRVRRRQTSNRQEVK